MPTLIDSYSESNYSNSYTWGDTLPDKRVGQSFANTNAGTLDSCKFYLRKANSPVGNIYVYLYAHTGTYGSGGKPTGSILATSDAIDASTLGTSFSLITFNFSGVNRYSLAASTKYCLVLRFETSSTSPNVCSYGLDATSPTHGGNYFYGDGTNFTASTEDMIFYVYGEPIKSGSAKKSQFLLMNIG